MQIPDDISYLLYWDDDTIPITGNMTFGNQLDNDIVVPGEDVADFHLRIDLSERGPVVIPLGSSTISVNGVERAVPLQVMIGDVIGIGHATMQIGVEIETLSGDAVEMWQLHPDDGNEPIDIAGEVAVGRSDTSDLQIAKEHISRNHARLVEYERFVWLQDLNSSNGTRINGDPLHGGARLFHGDYVSFDKSRYQLIGQGGALTPVEHFVEPLVGTTNKPPQPVLDNTQFVSDREALAVDESLPATHKVGSFLLGLSHGVQGQQFEIALGESLIGRGDHCDIRIQDATVSEEHAQIKVRPEGVVVTNLMSTNGTQINDVDITTAPLKDGDKLSVGEVALVFRINKPNDVREGVGPGGAMDRIKSRLKGLFRN